MPRSIRLALLSALLVVAAVAAFALLRDDGATTEPASVAAATTGQSTTTAAAPPATTADAAATTTATATDAPPPGTTTAAAAPPAPAPTTMTVRGGTPVGGVVDVRVRTGEVVDLRITADAPDEIHVHGYDVTAALTPGRTARVRFPARLEGIFEIELHESGEQLARLVVEPA